MVGISVQGIRITCLHDCVSFKPRYVIRAFLQEQAMPIVACNNHWDFVEPTIIDTLVDWAVPQLYLSIRRLKSCFVLQNHFWGALLMHYCFHPTAHEIAIIGIYLSPAAIDAQ